MPQGGVIMRKYKLLSAFLVLAISSGFSIPDDTSNNYAGKRDVKSWSTGF